MKQKATLGVLFILVIIFSPPGTVANQQRERLRGCLAVAGATDEEGFLQFDSELRAAASSQDATLFTVLAEYPLRLNADGGTTLIANASTLYTRAIEAFPPATRAKVLSTRVDDLICNNAGIAYGNGELWVAVRDQLGARRFVVHTINLPDRSNRGTAKVLFVCRTDASRIVVDRAGDDAVRLRSWSRPRLIAASPDVELMQGIETFEGTGPCAHRVWTFKTARGTHVVSESGCSDGRRPEGSLGHFAAEPGGLKPEFHWCF